MAMEERGSLLAFSWRGHQRAIRAGKARGGGGGEGRQAGLIEEKSLSAIGRSQERERKENAYCFGWRKGIIFK